MKHSIVLLVFASLSTHALADTVVFSSKVTAGSFSFFTDGSTRGVAGSVYPQDIDGDGIDEVIFAGIETAPNTPETYSNTRVFVFGWRNGVFQDITAQWLPGTSNEVEGVGDIGFGDFNGDGLLDAYLSATTDIQSPVDAFALMNRGGWFERVNLGENMEEHGVSIGDVNADGYDDVFASGYHAPFFSCSGAPRASPGSRCPVTTRSATNGTRTTTASAQTPSLATFSTTAP